MMLQYEPETTFVICHDNWVRTWGFGFKTKRSMIYITQWIYQKVYGIKVVSTCYVNQVVQGQVQVQILFNLKIICPEDGAGVSTSHVIVKSWWNPIVYTDDRILIIFHFRTVWTFNKVENISNSRVKSQDTEIVQQYRKTFVSCNKDWFEQTSCKVLRHFSETTKTNIEDTQDGKLTYSFLHKNFIWYTG